MKQKRRGRPKKMSIHQMQKIISKRVRIKHNTFYTNKINERKWGPIKDTNRSAQQRKLELEAIKNLLSKQKQAKQFVESQRNCPIIPVIQANLSKNQILKIQKMQKEQIQSSISCKKEVNQDKEVKKIKKEYIKKYTNKQKQQLFNLFQIDGGNFKLIMRQFPMLRRKPIRKYLRKQFVESIMLIMEMSTPLTSFTKLSIEQIKQIVKQMMRMRVTNRILSETDPVFRKNFMKIVRKHSLPPPQNQEQLSKIQIIELLHRLLQFARGTRCATSTPSTESAVATHSHSVLKQGGRAFKTKSIKISQQQQWKTQERCYLINLIIKGENDIKEAMILMFGQKEKWADFYLIQNQINKLTKKALNKLYVKLKNKNIKILRDVKKIQQKMLVYDYQSQTVKKSLLKFILDEDNEKNVQMALTEIAIFVKWSQKQQQNTNNQYKNTDIKQLKKEQN